jgi:hypothetical protein
VTWLIAVSLATIFGVPLGVASIWLVLRQQNREKAAAAAAAEQARAKELQDRYNAGLHEGIERAEPTAALLRSQRDDARRERDNKIAELKDVRDAAVAAAATAASRIQQLEDRLYGHHKEG